MIINIELQALFLSLKEDKSVIKFIIKSVYDSVNCDKNWSLLYREYFVNLILTHVIQVVIYCFIFLIIFNQ